MDRLHSERPVNSVDLYSKMRYNIAIREQQSNAAGLRRGVLYGKFDMRRTKTINLVLCGLFAALTGGLAQITIPIGPVPISLATFSVFMSGALLGAKFGALSQGVYVLSGAAGLPVFAGFKGGPGALVGPTGGYIAGYILTAWLVGLITDKFGNRVYVLALAMLAGFAAYMVTGTGWYMLVTGNGLREALMVCVVPFLPGDFLKMTGAVILSHRLRPVLQKRVNSVGS